MNTQPGKQQKKGKTMSAPSKMLCAKCENRGSCDNARATVFWTLSFVCIVCLGCVVRVLCGVFHGKLDPLPYAKYSNHSGNQSNHFASCRKDAEWLEPRSRHPTVFCRAPTADHHANHPTRRTATTARRPATQSRRRLAVPRPGEETVQGSTRGVQPIPRHHERVQGTNVRVIYTVFFAHTDVTYQMVVCEQHRHAWRYCPRV